MDSSLYISTHELLDHLNKHLLLDPISEYALRNRVIAALRDEGVIIASGTKGYKIPDTVRDIEAFVSLVNHQTMPYLNRLQTSREHFYMSTMGEYDIIDGNQFPLLRRCLDSMKKF